jgi:hypothetical protein
MQSTGDRQAAGVPTQTASLTNAWDDVAALWQQPSPVDAATSEASSGPDRPAPTYAISEALPLHVLGLVPPPPGIGPHLLTATPLEAALCAAELTAAELAIAPPQPPEPEPITQPEPETLNQHFDARPDASETAAITLMASGDTAAIAHDDADGMNGTHLVDGASSGYRHDHTGSVTDTATTAADAFDSPLPPALTDQHARSAGDGHTGLATLDLTRRSVSSAPEALPPPPKPLLRSLPHPSLLGVAAGDVPLQGGGYRRPTQGGPPSPEQPPPDPTAPVRGSWPGFLTGIVMAVAIGIGLYVSLSGT